MGWGDALAQLGRAFNAVWDWATGGRTREQNADVADAEAAQRAYDDAMARGRVADAAAARQRLLELRDKARARQRRP